MAGVDWSMVPSAEAVADELRGLMIELFPICRSLTGDGVRETLSIIGRDVPLEVSEVPTGTQVFDWTVPREWNIRDAWVDGPDGDRLIDFRRSNLHVLGYSVPINERLTLAELRSHLYTDPENPDSIPFRTSYYDENWGFCLASSELDRLTDGEYEVVIDSSLTDGSLTYAESFVPGATTDEMLVSTYVCHPSLCNDNLSGVVVAATLAKCLRRMPLRYTYRFLFGPGTIGPLCWLWKNEASIRKMRHGLTLSCVGDPGHLTYKRSRRGNTEIDQAAANVVQGAGGTVVPFEPWGGDERQFCSPGFNLPVGALARTPADRFPGYHSSADDLELVSPEALADSFHRVLQIIDVLETNGSYVSRNPKGEPQLGKRGLYRRVGGGTSTETALLWVLSLADGEHTLLDVSDRSGVPYRAIVEAAEALVAHDLLEKPAHPA